MFCFFRAQSQNLFKISISIISARSLSMGSDCSFISRWNQVKLFHKYVHMILIQYLTIILFYSFWISVFLYAVILFYLRLSVVLFYFLPTNVYFFYLIFIDDCYNCNRNVHFNIAVEFSFDIATDICWYFHSWSSVFCCGNEWKFYLL